MHREGQGSEGGMCVYVCLYVCVRIPMLQEVESNKLWK